MRTEDSPTSASKHQSEPPAERDLPLIDDERPAEDRHSSFEPTINVAGDFVPECAGTTDKQQVSSLPQGPALGMEQPVSSSQDVSDQRARDRVQSDLTSTLFVEAGAGSGKTAALVSRVVALVTSGVEMRQIAAITFTEKAAGELKARIRCELQSLAASNDLQHACLARAALDQLDSAAVGTLHSFARRILSENAIEAGLPPKVEVLDEIGSGIDFEHSWSSFRDQLLSDPSFERTILLLLSSGIKLDDLRWLVRKFEEDWDLVKSYVPATALDPPKVRDLIDQEIETLITFCQTPCSDPGDRLAQVLGRVEKFLTELRSSDDELDVLSRLDDGVLSRVKVGNVGKQANFACDIKGLKAQLIGAIERLLSVRDVVVRAAVEHLASALRQFTLDAADNRRRCGQLRFHDLLVVARSLLTDSVHGESICRRLHERYARILLDELQDTDPIQMELAVRIAACNEGHLGAKSWQELEVEPGSLFMVGDPKQSIYRFRRADIGVFMDARRRFGEQGGGLVCLTTNFRTVRPIIDWVNKTFSVLMHSAIDGPEVDSAHLADEPDAGEQRSGFFGEETDDVPREMIRGNVSFQDLVAVREGPEIGPPISVLGRQAHLASVGADEVREVEATEVAEAIVQVMNEQWQVNRGGDSWEPARLSDIAVLLPARTSLEFLEDALEEAGIPFRTESSSMVYASRPVRDLLMVLRAVGDPSDELTLVSALRTPLLGCGDDDLFRFRCERAGRWTFLSAQPETVPADDPVHLALAYLRQLHEYSRWAAPSELLERIARDRRAFEIAAGQRRPRDIWRRLRFVIDQARAWFEHAGGNLRDYLDWVSRQAAEGAWASEAILPESDDDAVRIMTIHAAKGLEFPIVIVSGNSAASQAVRSSVEVVFSPKGEVGYRVGSKVKTPSYMRWKQVDEQMALAERVRLMYVACTRARDHLIVSLHRKEKRSSARSSSATSLTNAELLVRGMGDLLTAIPDTLAQEAGTSALVGSEASDKIPMWGFNWEQNMQRAALPGFSQWAYERAQVLSAASVRRVVAATALTDEGCLDGDGPVLSAESRRMQSDWGVQEDLSDIDLPRRSKGRYGSDVGRAVHGVLQSIDLATGNGLVAVVGAQCEAEAVADRKEEVAYLVCSALESPSVREASRRPHWREMFVSTPVGDRLLEGYIDLLYRAPGGFVVLDYKTASSSDPAEIDARMAVYRNQGGAYALMVAEATGEPVVRVVFLFLTPQGAIERELDDLPGAIAKVRELVKAGEEVVAG